MVGIVIGTEGEVEKLAQAISHVMQECLFFAARDPTAFDRYCFAVFQNKAGNIKGVGCGVFAHVC